MSTKRKNKRNIALLAIIMLTALLLTASLSVITESSWAQDSEEPWEGFQWAGTWVLVLPVPDIGDVVLNWTAVPEGPGGDKFTCALRCVRPNPTFFGTFPDADHMTAALGQAVRIGLNTYEKTLIAYGTKKAELPGVLPEIVYIEVIYGKGLLTGQNTLEGEGTIAFFHPSADADGDGLPDEGAEPMACIPYTLTGKRVPLLPPCVVPPPPPGGE
jgi:hypothetical protein